MINSLQPSAERTEYSEETLGTRETLAEEISSTAYAVALQHKAGGSWIDLELNLWRAVSHMLKAAGGTDGSIA